MAGHIMREHDIYDFNNRFNLYKRNTGMCGDTLMNSHWEELIGKVEEFLHATDHPENNYCIYIQQIIQYSSDSGQCLKSFFKLYMIETMLLLSASGCASTLVDLQQQLADRAWWIYRWIVLIQLLTEYFTKPWVIILICIM